MLTENAWWCIGAIVFCIGTFLFIRKLIKEGNNIEHGQKRKELPNLY